jgi:hypothetical protein
LHCLVFATKHSTLTFFLLYLPFLFSPFLGMKPLMQQTMAKIIKFNPALYVLRER